MLKSVAQINTASLFQQIQSVSDPISYMERAAQRYPDIFKASILGFGNSGDRKQFTAPGELSYISKPILGDSWVIMLEGDRC